MNSFSQGDFCHEVITNSKKICLVKLSLNLRRLFIRDCDAKLLNGKPS